MKKSKSIVERFKNRLDELGITGCGLIVCLNLSESENDDLSFFVEAVITSITDHSITFELPKFIRSSESSEPDFMKKRVEVAFFSDFNMNRIKKCL